MHIRRMRPRTAVALTAVLAFAAITATQAAAGGTTGNNGSMRSAAGKAGKAGAATNVGRHAAPAPRAAVPKQSFAVVEGTGALVRGTPDIVSAGRIAAGAYQVLTTHAVTGCAYVADPGVTGSAGAINAPAFSVTALRSGTTTGVFVNTFDRTGVPTDFPFHLQITCAKAGKWAVVNGDGTISRAGTNVTGATRLLQGQYEVDFLAGVKKCAYTANVGNPADGNPLPLTVTVATRAGNTHGVYVDILDLAGAHQDASFHLNVACGTAAIAAVVNTTGTLVRGSNAVSVSHIAAGQYGVVFNRNVAACSFVASVADPGTGIAPQGTVTVAGLAGKPRGVFVQTFNLANTQLDRPFQLIVYC